MVPQKGFHTSGCEGAERVWVVLGEQLGEKGSQKGSRFPHSSLSEHSDLV